MENTKIFLCLESNPGCPAYRYAVSNVLTSLIDCNETWFDSLEGVFTLPQQYVVLPPFHHPHFRVYPHLTLFRWSQVYNLNIKFPPLKIFPSLVLKSIARQSNLKWGFSFILCIQPCIFLISDTISFRLYSSVGKTYLERYSKQFWCQSNVFVSIILKIA
jgi:hypothetical protein